MNEIDTDELEKIAGLIYSERQSTKSTIITIWIIGLIITSGGVIMSGWIWLWVLAVPIILNAFVVNNAYHRIARNTGLDPKIVHQYWRLSQNIDLHISH